MMTMKKLTALLMAVAMLFTLAACNIGSKDVGGTITPNVTTTGDSTTTTTEDATTTTTTAANTDTAQKKFAVGTTAGNTYENTFIGIGCELDGNWELTSSEEMRQMNESLMESLGEDYLAAVQNAEIVYDMMATNTTTGSSMNINLENLGLLYGSVLSAEDYLEASITQVDDMLGAMGFEGISIQETTFTLAGKTHPGIAIEMSMEGVALYEALVCIKTGNYMAAVTVAATTQAEINELLAKFYAV